MRLALAAWLTLASAAPASAEIAVAFLEMLEPDGRRMELERGDRFAHSALAHRGRWLQAFPGRGVELIDEATLRAEGSAIVVLVDEAASEIPDRAVRPLLGRPFDLEFDWSEDDRLYCAELIGKLLGVALPMRFDERWPPALGGTTEPGLSPDKLFRALKARGYRVRRF